jgi:preprotein translocase subunit SecA
MFGAMMEAIKEESVGFLFNLEVQVETEPSAAPDAEAGSDAVGADAAVAGTAPTTRDGQPASDAPAVSGELEHAATSDGHNGHGPQISAKGLQREQPERPLVYSAPTLGSDTPEIRVSDESKNAAANPESKTARRQQARANPNRGNRGNRGAGSRKRKR